MIGNYLSPKEKLDLKRLIQESDAEDNTLSIRTLKHSYKMKTDISSLVQFLNRHHAQSTSIDASVAEFDLSARACCPFLCEFYPDLFLKIMKNELDIIIMARFLEVLRMIEDGEVDQHEGSAIVGKILQELYLDSAVRRGENLDKEHPPPPAAVEGKVISWSEFKMRNRYSIFNI